ncbi:MAG: thioesterase family protein [Planctomycetota bacterium]|nr:thioesterase family protein [Planctomycetota bacterium]
MAHEFKQERRVEFSETDMAGIVHFSNFFRYMEATEHAFFRSLGLALHRNEGGVMEGWARVHAECDYLYPLRYQDVFEIRLTVREKNETSLAYDFAFRLPDQERDVARGAMKVVHVSKAQDDERMRPTPIPAEIAATIETAPET